MPASFSAGAEVLPGIHQVMRAFGELCSNGLLLRYTVASLFRVTAGFYAAVLAAVPLGIILGRIKAVNRVVNPAVQFLRPISPLAWIPFAVLWFGIGDRPALFIIFLSAFFPILISTTNASSSINPIYYQVAANLQLSLWESLFFVTLPAIMPNVMIALRVSLGVSWMVVVAAEMIAVNSGLGYLIVDARNALRFDYVIVAMITIGLIGLLLDWLILRIGRMDALRWKLEHS